MGLIRDRSRTLLLATWMLALGTPAGGSSPRPVDPGVQPVLVEEGEDAGPLLPRLRSLIGHRSTVTAVAWGSSGQVLASASRDATIILWDPARGHPIRTLSGHRKAVVALDLSPDEKLLASGSEDGTARLWDLTGGREIRTLSQDGPGVIALAFSPDGGRLATGARDGTLRVWNVAEEREELTLMRRFGPIKALRFHPDGEVLALACLDHTVRLLEVRTGRQVRLLAGHRESVFSVSFSPDGRLLASGSRDGSLRLWDVATGREAGAFTGHVGVVDEVEFALDGRLVAYNTPSTVGLVRIADGRRIRLTGVEATSLSFAPDGRTVAFGSPDGRVRLWDPDRERGVRLAVGRERRVAALAFHPDGTRLACGSPDGQVRILDVATDGGFRTLTDRAGEVTALAFGPRGEILASGAQSGSISLWNATSGRELRILTGHARRINALGISPDGRTLASGSADRTVSLWEVATGRRLHTLFVGKWTWSVSFTPDGRTLAADCRPGVCLWEVATGRRERTLEAPGGAGAASFSPDGRTVVAVTDVDSVFRFFTLRLWDVAGGREIRAFGGSESWYNAVAFSPDGAVVAAGSRDGTVRLWDAANGREVTHFRVAEGGAEGVRFSPAGTIIAALDGRDALRLWDLASGREIRPAIPLRDGFEAVRFRPDGRLLAAGSQDGTVRLWDPAAGRALRTLGGPAGRVLTVAFSPDGKTVAAGSVDGTARVWEAGSGREVHVLRGHSDWVRSVAFSPDGQLVASGSDDATVRLWDLAAGRELQVLAGHYSFVYAVAFSPDGELVASGSRDQTVRLWDLAAGREALLGREGASPLVIRGDRGGIRGQVLAGHDDRVYAVDFSPDGALVASGSADGTIRIWDLARGEEVHRLGDHAGEVSTVRFAAGGATLVSGSRDGSVRIWDLAGGGELQRLAAGERVQALDLGPGDVALAVAAEDGAVRLGTLRSGSWQWQLRGFAGGGWMAARAGGRLYRADDGRQLIFGLPGEEPQEPLMPPRPAAPARLVASWPEEIAVPSRAAGVPVPLVVVNAGAGPAFWVRVRPAAPVLGFGVWAEGYRSRLDPGVAVEIPLTISYLPGPESGGRDVEATLPLLLSSAYDEPQPLELRVRVIAPAPEVEAVAVVTDSRSRRSALRVTVANRGEQGSDALTATVYFVDRETGAARAMAPEEQTIPALGPGESALPVLFSVPGKAEGMGDRLSALVVVRGSWPGQRWISQQPIALGAGRGFPFAWAGGTLLLIAAVSYLLVWRHPWVVVLAAEPAQLRDLPSSAVPAVDRRLRLAFRLGSLLRIAGIPGSRWRQLVATARSPARGLAAAVGAELGAGEEIDGGLRFHPLTLPPLPLATDPNAGLFEVRGEAPLELASQLAAAAAERGLSGALLVILDRTPGQDVRAKLTGTLLRHAVIDEAQLTRLLLADDPVPELVQRLS